MVQTWGLRLRRHWWTRSAVAAIFTVVAYIAQVELGQSLPTWAHIALLTAGSLSALLGFLFPLRFAQRQSVLRQRAEDVAEQAVRTYKLQVHDVFIPLSGLVSSIISDNNSQSCVASQERLKQSVVDLAAGNILAAENTLTPRTRACFFEYSNGPPKSLTSKTWKGRNRGPRGPYVEGTARGNAMLALLEGNQTKFVLDAEKEKIEGWSPTTAEYRTFIAVPVIAGLDKFGLLTLDAPEPGDLREDDELQMRLFAQLLATGLAAP